MSEPTCRQRDIPTHDAKRMSKSKPTAGRETVQKIISSKVTTRRRCQNVTTLASLGGSDKLRTNKDSLQAKQRQSEREREREREKKEKLRAKGQK